MSHIDTTDACSDTSHSPRYRGGMWTCPDCDKTDATQEEDQ